MKLSIMVLLLGLLIISESSFAQRMVNVAPGFGTINNIIGGDTTATGARVDSNTVYVLERGGLYILDGEFSPSYQCIIEAAEGDGPRPRIVLGVPTGGTTPEQAIRPRANFWIKGCYVSAQDELGGMGTRIFRFEGNGVKIVVDDCHLDIASQAAYRINTDNNILYLTNSIVSNIGTMASPENGRAFDDRGNDVDTIYVENCTFYNLTFRVLRDGGGRINYAYFNHNTIMNIGFGAIDLGEVLTARVTNNIIKNGNFLGVNDATGDYIIETLPWTGTETPDIVISNNNIFTDPALIAAFPDTIAAPVRFDSLTISYIEQGGHTASNIDENLEFTDGPASPIAEVTAFFQDPTTSEGFLDTTGQANFNFAYPTTAQSYTAGTDGKPLGALNWFGMTVDVNDNLSEIPENFELHQNYPNPFNPTTKISYNLPANSFVTLKIYNVLGKEIAVLVNGEQQAGRYELNFNASNLTSGVYFYKIETESFTKTNKMLLMK